MDNSLTAFPKRIKFNISSRVLNHNTPIPPMCRLGVLTHQRTEDKNNGCPFAVMVEEWI